MGNAAQATLTALLGENYMVDSDRGSNFTVPGRKANTDWHRDGNDKRRHHHPRMLMGLYCEPKPAADAPLRLSPFV